MHSACVCTDQKPSPSGVCAVGSCHHTGARPAQRREQRRGGSRARTGRGRSGRSRRGPRRHCRVSAGRIAAGSRCCTTAVRLTWRRRMTAVNDFNRSLIEEFRANDGKVERSLRGRAAAAAHDHRREDRAQHTTPVVYLRRTATGCVDVRVEGRRADASGLVPQPRREPGRDRGAARREVRRARAVVAEGAERERLWDRAEVGDARLRRLRGQDHTRRSR